MGCGSSNHVVASSSSQQPVSRAPVTTSQAERDQASSTKHHHNETEDRNTKNQTEDSDTNKQTEAESGSSTGEKQQDDDIKVSLKNQQNEQSVEPLLKNISGKSDEDEVSAVKTDEKQTDFRNAALTSHNQLRKKHDSPPMKLTSAMNQKAQAWAEKLARMNTLQHSKNTQGGPGENLYMSMPAGKPVEDAVAACQAWYDEIDLYNFNKPGFAAGTGHFTQLVWKTSTELGVGLATSSSGAVYVVANYNPAGNVANAGFFEENVQKP